MINKTRLFPISLCFLFILANCFGTSTIPCQLSVSSNGRYLQENDDPFFYLGDTAWFLFTAVGSAAATEYRDNRKQMGFNTIQLHITPHYYDDKNFWGELPYIEDDATQLNEKYWHFSRWIVQQAQKRGSL